MRKNSAISIPFETLEITMLACGVVLATGCVALAITALVFALERVSAIIIIYGLFAAVIAIFLSGFCRQAADRRSAR